MAKNSGPVAQNPTLHPQLGCATRIARQPPKLSVVGSNPTGPASKREEKLKLRLFPPPLVLVLSTVVLVPSFWRISSGIEHLALEASALRTL